MGGTTSFDLKSYLASRREKVDAALDGYLPPESARPETLHRAMRYSVFSGGKRFRPVLCIAAFEACKGTGDVLPVACALELIHTYSLIHDDLPCMDDDDMRRGKPTSHRVFGEAAAVLAGDALLTFAVELLVGEGGRALGPDRALRVSADIAGAIGSDGMVAGQMLDMECENRETDGDLVEYIHSRKTGRLITASVRSGAVSAGAEGESLERLTRYGRALGLAFQIVDDILDEEGAFGRLKSGKGLDGARGKATYPGVFGVGRSRAMARELVAEAVGAIDGLGEGFAPLEALADFVASRGS